MILILLSWIYIFFTSVVVGFAFNKLGQLKNKNYFELSILGFFSTTIIASVWAIFARINIEFHIFILLFNFSISLLYKSELISLFKSFFNQVNSFSKSQKIFILLSSLLVTLKCTFSSNFIDNETYYIQTIKWLNEFGFVKGLANLHVFFGQTSGWHILQSAFSFSFLNSNLNDLNGLFLIMSTIFAISKLNSYWQNNNKNLLIIGLLPMINLFLFQFIGVPSPDLAVYIISFLLFYYFLINFDAIKVETFNLIFILSIFIVYIKITALPILLFPIVLFILNFKKLFSKIYISYTIGLIVFCLFVLKNLIITGYPFFPSLFFKDVFNLNYALPIELYDFSFNTQRLYNFTVLKSEFKRMDVIHIFIKWLLYSKIDSIFNSAIIVSILMIPYFLKRFFNKASYWILYFGMLIQLIFLFLTSPQYRFILNFVLFFGFIMVSCLISKRKTITFFLYLSLIPILFLIVFPIKTYSKNNTKIFKEASFSLIENLLIPQKKSSLNCKYQKNSIGNLDYYSPNIKPLLWATGDGNLPCVNKTQLLFFKKKYGYIPQKLTSNLADGFYSKKTLNESN
jgi:hypothetical protein